MQPLHRFGPFGPLLKLCFDLQEKLFAWCIYTHNKLLLASGENPPKFSKWFVIQKNNLVSKLAGIE